jgi:DDE superfamily endonuclease
MLPLPVEIITVLRPFAPAFRARVWTSAQVLLVGAILAPGRRTVASVLRVVGLSQERHFTNYHRVLNRDHWSSRALSRILLGLLLAAFVPADAPVVVGIDEHIERRRGAKIAAKGIYRDPVRTSKEHFVKTSGLRWISLQLLAGVPSGPPWARRVWGLPFLTVLAPSERYHQRRGRRHKTITDWGRQMLLQVRRWLPERAIVVVADSTYAVLGLLDRCRRLAGKDRAKPASFRPITVITRLRLDAALYDPAPPRTAGTKGRPRRKGRRQPTVQARLIDPQAVWEALTVRWYGGVLRTIEVATATAIWYHGGMPPAPIRWVLIRDPDGGFEPQALLSTDLELTACQIVEWYVLRWQLDVTFHEVRDHLGVETQRQWSDLAILRTTPALLALFSLVTLVAHRLDPSAASLRQAAWYEKALPTFADALAVVREHLWPVALFPTSRSASDMVQIPRALFERVTETLAFAA